MPFIVIALVIAAALGGGTAAAAQYALPGDALWGFKVGINEQLSANLAPSGGAKAAQDIAAIEARLDEARALAAQGALGAHAQASIDANISAHATAIAREITALQAQGNAQAAADVAARYQAALAARVSTLGQTEGGVGAEASLSPIVERVRTALDVASTLSAQANLAASATAGL